MTRSSRLLLPLAAAVLLAGCAAPDPAPADSGSALGDGHGFVAGATEVSDPPSTLAMVSPEGDVVLRDLVTDKATVVGEIAPPERIAADGRFLYGVRDGAVDVVDTGVWTQPHGDHVHYYRAEPRFVATIEGAGLASVTWAGDRAALRFDDGAVVVLDRQRLGQGDADPELELSAAAIDADVVIPLSDGLLVGDATADEARVLSDAGDPVGDPVACLDPAAAAPSRPGVVMGCADGAVLVAGGELAGGMEPIPLGSSSGPAELRSRADRAGLAGTASDGSGIWLLDVRGRRWAQLPAPAALVAVTAVDDADEHVLALADDGSLLVLDGTGTFIGRTAPLVAESLADPASAAGVRLDVDADRAYLTGPAEGTVWELDYRDGGRIAREFAMPVGGFAAEVGR